MPQYSSTVGGQTYRFDDLRALLACASSRRSGDELAGLCAASDQHRIAARYALADLPLKVFLDMTRRRLRRFPA
jgi:ethanolamine ammonia-lyase large subunit